MRILGFLIMVLTATSALATDFVFDSIDGGTLSLSDFRGGPILVVNSASRCGFTPQYQGLQKLHETYKDKGLTVLVVPSNDFRQELSTEEDVKEFCDLNYSLTMPMTTITSIKGATAHPFYAWLKQEHGVVPKWNFNKILLDANGNFVGNFGSITRPMSGKITKQIDKLL